MHLAIFAMHANSAALAALVIAPKSRLTFTQAALPACGQIGPHCSLIRKETSCDYQSRSAC
jgi:hypothetical protein